MVVSLIQGTLAAKKEGRNDAYSFTYRYAQKIEYQRNQYWLKKTMLKSLNVSLIKSKLCASNY